MEKQSYNRSLLNKVTFKKLTTTHNNYKFFQVVKFKKKCMTGY